MCFKSQYTLWELSCFTTHRQAVISQEAMHNKSVRLDWAQFSSPFPPCFLHHTQSLNVTRRRKAQQQAVLWHTVIIPSCYCGESVDYTETQCEDPERCLHAHSQVVWTLCMCLRTAYSNFMPSKNNEQTIPCRPWIFKRKTQRSTFFNLISIHHICIIHMSSTDQDFSTFYGTEKRTERLFTWNLLTMQVQVHNKLLCKMVFGHSRVKVVWMFGGYTLSTWKIPSFHHIVLGLPKNSLLLYWSNIEI